MFREQDLYKAATFYSTKNSKYKNNFTGNKSFAETAVDLNKDYGPSERSKLRHWTESQEMEGLAVSTRLSRLAKTYKSTSPQFSMICWSGTSPSNRYRLATKRPASEINRPEFDISKLSNITNFKK
jgi:hypothetical protein